MKKVILGLLSLLVFSFSMFGQEDPAKAMKKAGRALGAYNANPTASAAKLDEAKKMIDIAITSEEVAAMSKAWNFRGGIYSAIMNNEFAEQLKQETLGATYEIGNMDAALEAHKAYKMALEKAVKGYEKKDALNGIKDNISNLQNVGITLFKGEKAGDAYNNFVAALEADELLKANKEESPFAEKEQYNNAVYLTGYSALAAGMNDEAKPHYDALYAAGSDEPTVYEGIYKLYKDTDIEKALGALQAGVAKFPDNQALSYAQINYYIAEGKLDELVTKLKGAIAADPDNVSLYSVLGNTYDNLSTKEAEAGNDAKSKEYFDNAMSYYTQALEKDPKNTDAIYSVGTLYYNKAAARTKDMVALDGKFDKASMAKYDAIQKEVKILFEQALPYFQKVEKLNPNDRNTLIALKEIYAKSGDIVMSKEFKTRLENVGKNESSYFATKGE